METKPITTVTKSYQARGKYYLVKRHIARAFGDAGRDNVAKKLYDCQETESLVFCSSCGNKWWVVTKCKLRVCPLCSYEEARRRGDMLVAISARMKFPKHLILTLPEIQRDGRAGIKKLRAAWNKLRRTTLMKEVEGGAYSIELKPKENGWHVHLHALLDCPFLPYQKIFSEWCRILNVTHVEIQIKCAESESQRRYMAKYVGKNESHEDNYDRIVEWYECTKGLRLFEIFGSYRAAAKALARAEKEKRAEGVPCRFCGALHTVSYARDGPRLYGKDWLTVKPGILGEDEPLRDITAIRNACDNDMNDSK